MKMVIQGEGYRGQGPIGACLRLDALKKEGDVLEIPDVGVIDDAGDIIKDKRVSEGAPVKAKGGQSNDRKGHGIKWNLLSHPTDCLPHTFSLNRSPVFSIERLPEPGSYSFLITVR